MKDTNAIEKALKVFHLNDQDIELIVKLLHQELDAVHTILENSTTSNLDTWYNRADHCEDLIMELTK
jgi:hypothetical protein